MFSFSFFALMFRGSIHALPAVASRPTQTQTARLIWRLVAHLFTCARAILSTRRKRGKPLRRLSKSDHPQSNPQKCQFGPNGGAGFSFFGRKYMGRYVGPLRPRSGQTFVPFLIDHTSSASQRPRSAAGSVQWRPRAAGGLDEVGARVAPWAGLARPERWAGGDDAGARARAAAVQK